MTDRLPINADGFPGFFEVPGFNRYCVNKEGIVVNKLSGKVVHGSTNPAGYHNYRLTDDQGYCYTYGRHRLLCDVFKRHLKYREDLVVNHRNGIKGFDELNNLEWLSTKENIEHAGAMGLSLKCRPISVRNVDTGIVLDFPSIIECAKHFGLSKDAVNYRVKIGEKRVFPERNQYRYKTEEPWYIPNRIENKLFENGRSRAIMVRNLLNGKIKTYRNITSLAEELQVLIPTITNWLSQKDQPVIPGFLQLKWAFDCNDWRPVEDPYLEVSDFNKLKPIQITDEKTQVKKIYLSRAECCKELGIHYATLDYRVKTNGQRVFKDGKRYQFYESIENSPTL